MWTKNKVIARWEKRFCKIYFAFCCGARWYAVLKFYKITSGFGPYMASNTL
jgi:hypothetical protein